MFTALAIFSMLMVAAIPIFKDGGDDDSTPPDDDILRGTDGADTLTGDEGTSLIDAGAGDDSIVGQDGTDIDAGAGDDTIRSAGFNEIYGGDGDDEVFGLDDGGALNTTVYGGAGDDLVNAGGDDSTIYGGAGNDTLGGAMVVDGGAGDDDIGTGVGGMVTSGEGADTISATVGVPSQDDTWNGGPSTVTDYVAGQDLYQLFGTYSEDDDGVLIDGPLTFVVRGSDVDVEIGGTPILRLQGIDLADVDQSDFLQDRPPV